jgi:hypothetical protein
MKHVSVYIDPKVHRVIELYADILARDFHSLPIGTQLGLQAARLTAAHHNRDDSVCFQIGSWHPDLVGQSDERILNHPFSVDDAQVTIAREHGFKNWGGVEAIDRRVSDVAFENAVDTMLSGNLASLGEQVRKTPDLLSTRSQYGHSATLLHYAGTNGVESYRQIVPLNLAEIVDFLIAAGADQHSKANIYGGSTPRQLFESSKHSYESKVYKDVVGVFSKHEATPR